jgi:hypothetical protein
MKLIIKIPIIAVIIGLVSAIAYFGFISPQVDRAADVALATVSREAVGLSFSYPSGEDGLSLIEPPTTENTSLLEAFILMPLADFQEQQSGNTPTDAPATISIFVFDEDTSEPAELTIGTASGTADISTETATETPRVGRITRLQNWAADNQNFTSISQAKNTPEVLELDGVNALYYEADGLFQQQIYLAAYKGNIYMFVGQYNDSKDAIYQQFKDIIATVSFD